MLQIIFFPASKKRQRTCDSSILKIHREPSPGVKVDDDVGADRLVALLLQHGEELGLEVEREQTVVLVPHM